MGFSVGDSFLTNVKRIEVKGAGSGNRERYKCLSNSPPCPTTPLGLQVLVKERGQVRDTGRQIGDAGHGVDIAEPSILALLKVDAARGEDGGIFIKEVIGSEKEANSVS